MGKDQSEPLYCNQQIAIPPGLPDMLKQFTKSAIRTQPEDVLQWSYEYFQALADGLPPPVKERLSTGDEQTGHQQYAEALSKKHIQLLKVKLVQLSDDNGMVSSDDVEREASEIGFPRPTIHDVIRLGEFDSGRFEWIKFFSLCCTLLAGDLPSTLDLFCNTVSDNEKGMIGFENFKSVLCYLAKIDGELSEGRLQAIIEDLEQKSLGQGGNVAPVNLRDASGKSIFS
eukprot:Nk52_evm34s2391 gene=Nk52_evmTU34s2391